MPETRNNNLKTKSSISNRISGSKMAEYKAKVAELSVIANELSPEGLLIISLHTKDESFSPVVKAQKDIMDLEVIYSYRNIQSDPSMISEQQEVLGWVNDIQKTVGKRKKLRRNSYKKKRGDS